MLAHQLADLLALLAAQVQLGERRSTAVVIAVVRAAFWHGHGDGRQCGSEHQGDKGLAHGVSPFRGR
ncbi:hypothetical protein D3C74_479700 [compost metagenome]